MTKSRLDTLTPAQWEAVYAERRRWLDWGMSTDRTDRPAVEAAIADLYAAKGHSRPLFVWAESPWSALAMGAMCKSLTGDQLRGQLRGQFGDQLWDQLRDQLGDQLWDQLRDQLWGQLGDQLGDQLWGQLGDQLRGQLRGQLGDQLRGQLRGIYNNTAWTGWWATWLAFYRIPHILGHVTYTPEATALMEQFITVTMGTPMWLPYNGICLASDRPTSIAMTGEYDTARLHNPDGPAITFADGWTIHAWNGTRVPASLIDRGWTVEEILREPNSEIRRCAIERMGWPEFIAAAQLTQIGEQAQDPGNPGHTLTLYDLPEQIFDEPVRILLCTNATVERDGSRRRFGLTVPAGIDNPVHAAAWTFDVPAHVYKRLARAC